MSSGRATLIVGTAGHIDHGKTALVKALTGIDADRLPEEKRRGITIDLGFASTELRTKDGAPLSLSFIDVPGHRLFVRNMLAGAAGIDCVMLVISAEDGIMPQTEEHVAICRMLGVTRGVVVLSKIDMVAGDRLAQVREEVAGFMDSCFLRGSALLGVSAVTGAGLPGLYAELESLTALKPQRSQSGLLRLPIDRAFVIRGFGTVVTGTLKGGSLSRGQALTLEPGGVPVKARGLQAHHHSIDAMAAGSRVAVNLTGVEVSGVHRGGTLVEPHSLVAVDIVDAEIELLACAAPLRHKSCVRFHCFTSETVARVLFYENRPLQPGSSAIVRLKLAKPIVVLPQDRFVLRRLSPMGTIGGGRVLDVPPIPRTRKVHTFAWLQKIRHASLQEQLSLRVARRGTGGLTLTALSRELGWTKEEVAAAARPMIEVAELTMLSGELLLSAQAFLAARMQVLDLLGSKENHPGIKRSELRSQTGLGTEVFDAVLGAADVVSLYRDAPQLPEADRKAMEEMSAAYKSPGLEAPLFSDVMRSLGLKEVEARRLMTLLLREKILIKLGAGDLFVHASALIRLQQEIRPLRGQTLDVSRFKQMTGLSRKYAIPLLEYLDRVHVTRKQGDSRVVL